MPLQERKASVRTRTRQALAGILCLAGAAWIAREVAGARTNPQDAVVVRTATIASGDLERTIRVSGVVQAERFASLMAPRLRGSRGASGSFGGGGTKSLVGSTGSTVAAATSSTA